MNFPEDLKYTKEHEWVRVEGDVATVGITEYAQRELGDIVYVDVEALDDDVDQDGVFGSVEAVKTVSDLFMPVGGTVIELNEALDGSPELLNSDPYGEGWMIKIKMSDPSQVDGLWSHEDYKDSLGL